jgi:outer membrane receptor protein involved in Fe transport
MRNRFLLFGFLFSLVSTITVAQTQYGKLSGTVTSRDKGEPVIGATVKLSQEGSKKAIKATDLDGKFSISAIDPGVYDLQITYLGFDTIRMTGIKILAGSTTDLDPKDLVMHEPENGHFEVTVVSYRSLNQDNTQTINSVTGEEFQKMAGRGYNTIVLNTGGVSQDGGGNISFKGSRPGTSQYIVDGVKVGSGAANLPKSSISSVDVISGGLPAEYGDFTGGVVSVTTKGPSANFSGGIEGLTSQFIDPFKYNLIEGYLSGPMIRNKKDQSKAILGFSLSGNYTHAGTNSPPAIDLYTVKDDVLARIKANPVVQSPVGNGYISSASFVTLDQMQKTRVEPNTAAGSYSFTGKLDFQPKDNIDVTLLGAVDHSNRNAFIYAYSMFNAANNPQVLGDNYRASARFMQRFKSDSNSLIQDAFYTIQLSFTDGESTVQDPRLKDNFFGYGYLGRFDRTFTPLYLYTKDSVHGKEVLANYLQGYQETSVRYTPGGLNPDAESYAKEYFDLNGGSAFNFTQIRQQGGLINGLSPSLVYSLWSAPGTNYSSYSKSQSQNYDLNASGTATINKKHTIKFGIEYEQSVSRSFTVGGNFFTAIEDLWTIARSLLNSHLTQLDKANPILVYSNGSFTDTVNYFYQIAPGAQSTFDKNFRQYLINQGARDQNGKPIDQQSYINLDQYTPNDLKLSYFSPDELLNSGHSYVNAYGYDYSGNKIASKQSLADFLDPQKRAEGAYNPIYTAGYIQDKFELKDIKFNIGLRVDRFDANQKVLVDPYSLFPVKTAGEVSTLRGVPVTHPGNIGTNYYVYVDDITNPTKITGYRNGSTWYTASGAEESDPKQIAQLTRTGSIAPLLEDPTQTTLSANSFKDYVPQINVMPRVSFSFPISTVANFYANYTVLTVRPNANFGALDYYYYINTRSTFTLPNPDLKPEQETNYEIGFKQAITKYTFLSINAYYKEDKNLVQLQRFNYAYPITYTSFGNLDFSTVKGVIVGFDTRNSVEHPFSGLNISANYTLQFADGTGSGATTAGDLLSAGYPNLRTIFPLDYDVRNQIKCVLDYRFGMLTDYVGPISANGNKWLSNAGINLILIAQSGTPYTAQSNVTPDVEIGVSNRSSIVGSINGERKPWMFRADMRIDKTFNLNTGGKNKAKQKDLYVNVYLQVQNLMDAQNIVSVYRYTGLPNQDGYLQSPSGKSEASNSASQQAFIDQYTVKLNNPANYVSPRFIRLGASVNF